MSDTPRRGSFLPKGQIPGVGGRPLRRGRGRGSATAPPDPYLEALRARGVPVFDRQAGQAELGGYVAPR